MLEPGRSIVGPAGDDALHGRRDQAHRGGDHVRRGRRRHGRQPAAGDVRRRSTRRRGRRADEGRRHTYAIAGKHCESGDVLIEAAHLPELRPGDVLALAATGAYTATMASTYNGLPRPAAVMVADGARARRRGPRDRRRPARARRRALATSRPAGRRAWLWRWPSHRRTGRRAGSPSPAAALDTRASR